MADKKPAKKKKAATPPVTKSPPLKNDGTPRKSLAGRPPIYTTAADMQDAIDQYYDDCKADERPLTIMGLALSIGMCRDTLIEYAKVGKFSDTVKKAKQKVEQAVEERLFAGNCTGAIFWLKNNSTYKDKTESDVNVSGLDCDPLSDLERANRLAVLITAAQKRAASGDNVESAQ